MGTIHIYTQLSESAMVAWHIGEIEHTIIPDAWLVYHTDTKEWHFSGPLESLWPKNNWTGEEIRDLYERDIDNLEKKLERLCADLRKYYRVSSGEIIFTAPGPKFKIELKDEGALSPAVADLIAETINRYDVTVDLHFVP